MYAMTVCLILFLSLTLYSVSHKTNLRTHLLLTPLYRHCATPTCFGPQRAIFRQYAWYISTARSSK